MSAERTLEFVQPSAEASVNVLLYGGPKTGKTVGAGTAPGPILYLNADRPNATRMVHARREDIYEVRVDGLEPLLAAAELIQGGSSDIASVVLDPIADVYRAVLEGLSGRALRPKIQEYGDTGTHVERFCRFLCEQPVHAVFCSHETVVKDEEAGTFERLPYTGTSNPAFAQKLMAMVDVIGYTGVVPGEGEQAPRYMAQLYPAGGRRGGDRFGVLGQARDVDLAEWVELIGSETAPMRAPKEGAAA